MDKTKLNELAAKAMGWVNSIDPVGNSGWLDASGIFHDVVKNPATCADDALVLLEKVAVGSVCEGWNMEVRTPNGKRRFAVDCDGCWGNADTAALAMTFCALRAFGIPESEIQEALK